VHQRRSIPGLAARIEELGYRALWLGGAPDGNYGHIEQALRETERLIVATAVVNIWKDAPQSAADIFQRLDGRYPGRLLLGVGAGHREMADAYDKPYQSLGAYLDVLDEHGVPPQRRALAALGPRTLRLAARRSRGAHPYNVTPEHTASARAAIGPQALLAPEQKVVLESGGAARDLARSALQPYLGMTNYVTNFRRMGFDVGDGDSDRLVDGLFAFGAQAGAERVAAHQNAGADHVALQIIASPDAELAPLYAELAAALAL
jgi:probable F420-dependent oxidoreductase